MFCMTSSWLNLDVHQVQAKSMLSSILLQLLLFCFHFMSVNKTKMIYLHLNWLKLNLEHFAACLLKPIVASEIQGFAFLFSINIAGPVYLFVSVVSVCVYESTAVRNSIRVCGGWITMCCYKFKTMNINNNQLTRANIHQCMGEKRQDKKNMNNFLRMERRKCDANFQAQLSKNEPN